jgi:hypothetical protein
VRGRPGHVAAGHAGARRVPQTRVAEQVIHAERRPRRDAILLEEGLEVVVLLGELGLLLRCVGVDFFQPEDLILQGFDIELLPFSMGPTTMRQLRRPPLSQGVALEPYLCA